MVEIDESGHNPDGVLFRYTIDTLGENRGFSIEQSKQMYTPQKPLGDTLAAVGDSNVYRTGGTGLLAFGGLEYRFCFYFSDSVLTVWQNDSVVTRVWSEVGDFTVKAQSRSRVDTGKVSFWSLPLMVKVR
jgi:hypothetical protein